MVLGDIAFERERWLEAAQASTSRSSAARRRSRKEDAARVLVSFMEAFGKSYAARVSQPPPSTTDLTPASSDKSPLSRQPVAASHPRMIAAVEALQRVAPDDVEAAVRVSKVVFEHGEARGAMKVHQELLEKYESELTSAERAEALYRLGESARRVEEWDAAIEALVESADLDPSNGASLQSLAGVYEARGDWKAVVRAKTKRLEVASGTERFDLLLEIGDIFFSKLEDRTRAPKSVRRGARGAPRRPQAPHEADAALLGGEGLGEARRRRPAPRRFRRGPEAAGEVHADRGDRLAPPARRGRSGDQVLRPRARVRPVALEGARRGARAPQNEGRSRRRRARPQRAASIRRRTATTARRSSKTLDQLGALYHKFLGEPAMAIDAYEAAQAFDPEDRARAEILAELYASDVKQYLDKAVRAQAQILRKNPYRVESYKLLRRLYTEAKRADPAWCLCQALSVMNFAEPDEERFYKRHRADNAAAAQATLDEEAGTSCSTHFDARPAPHEDLRARAADDRAHAHASRSRRSGYDSRYAIDHVAAPVPGLADAPLRGRRARLAAPIGLPEPERPGGSRLPPRAHAGDRARARGVRGAASRRRRWRSSPGATSRTSAPASTCGTSCRRAPGSRRGSSRRSSCASRSSPIAPDLAGPGERGDGRDAGADFQGVQKREAREPRLEAPPGGRRARLEEVGRRDRPHRRSRRLRARARPRRWRPK